jgi:sugar lactone lactonase YvrE
MNTNLPLSSASILSLFRHPLMLLATVLFCIAPVVAAGQGVTYNGANPSMNFGSMNVCPSGQTAPAPCNETLTLKYNVTAGGTLGPPKILTLGAPNLDFTLAGGSTCIGQVTANSTCVVNVSFAPRFSGARNGAVLITDESGTVLATTFVYGVGVGPQLAFQQSTETTIVGGLFQPIGIAVDGAGDVIIADTYNNRVLKVPAGGGEPTTIGTGIATPVGVTVDGVGNVFITEGNGQDFIWKVSAESGAQTTVGSGLSYPYGVAVDGAGDVYIADTYNNRIVKVPADGGAQTTVATGFRIPTTVTVDALSNLFVADTGNSRVVKIPADGGAQTTVGSGLNRPSGAVADAAEDVFIADTYNDRVVEVPADGSPQITLGTGLTLPSGVTLDSAGNVFVTRYLTAGNAVELHRSQPPQLSFFPEQVDSISVENVGDATLSLSGLTLSPEGDFSLVPGSGTPPDCTASSSLSAGASCNLSIELTSQSPNGVAGTLTLTDNSLNGNPATQMVPLAGIGPVAQVSATVLQFGTIPFNTTETSQLIVTNIGTGTLTVAPSIDGQSFKIAGSTCGAGVTSGLSCTLQVQFSPVTVGAHNEALTLQTNGPKNPGIALEGVADVVVPPGTPPEAQVSTNYLPFGTVPFGTTKTLLLTVTNIGGGTLTVTPSISGYNSPAPSTLSYTIAGSTCGGGLTSGKSCTLQVQFTPTSFGTHTELLTLETNGSANPTVGLQGMVSGLSVLGGVNGASLKFGSVSSGSTEVLPLTVTNVGLSGMVTVGTAITVRNTATPTTTYTVLTTAQNTCLAGIAAGQSCTLTVEFSPTSSGTHDDLLTLTPSAGGGSTNLWLIGSTP